ncbi:altronate dehydratase large subunit [Clostridium tetanomorphum]|uniref:UxaA family hydrolase n=1 Tax=Clostridium tetanomorphum TaxID=1553 RepID=A0A923J291_CLOTT|nr:UxaA family hydrolase [Clostridium tetanomorphum]KAJ50290.1 altronate dehydratase [Clostridium tetanomorphum DSM 665]MBC2400017.1 UxaA family hydrolase [Clostridium tetanomorphum]MBP1864543.1 altronate dehydratase large subunit [Clostridium tetanomorphum]NRS82925.1 altronate dehydratase large subunit [Clostridium tetanomorphum]NRZ98979.1 altronate dehydratase large subunit [Clostridium tetanomorphum]
MKIYGYRRENGKVGIRNHILVIPASVCASEVAARIANHVNGAVAIPNQHGCCQVGPDLDLTGNVLIGLGKNPNVAAVLVVGLGCEGVPAKKVAEEIGKTGKRSECIIIQENGGTLNTEAQGIKILREMAEEVGKMKKEEIDISEITLAIECGGSDTTSGLASNPSVGYASDKLVDCGGTSIFSETTEFIGAEHILAKRAVTKEIGDNILKIVSDCEKKAMTMGVDMRGGQPTPGNIQGGLTTIEEKSLGCIYKGGTRPIQGVLEYAEIPEGKGLYIMDTPGQDIESITGMTAGGAQIVVFTTGRGTPTGSPIAPVIKVTGNPDTFKMMKDNIDINAGTVIEGIKTIQDIGEEIFEEMCEVINGKLTKAEALNHKEFGIYKLISTF